MPAPVRRKRLRRRQASEGAPIEGVRAESTEIDGASITPARMRMREFHMSDRGWAGGTRLQHKKTSARPTRFEGVTLLRRAHANQTLLTHLPKENEGPVLGEANDLFMIGLEAKGRFSA